MAKYPTFEPAPPMLTGNEIRRLYDLAHVRMWWPGCWRRPKS